MVGAIIGLITGAAMFWLLSKFTASITTGKSIMKGILFGMASFLLPTVVLVAMAFIIRPDLLWTAIAITVALMGSAIIKYVLSMRKTRGREDKNG